MSDVSTLGISRRKRMINAIVGDLGLDYSEGRYDYSGNYHADQPTMRKVVMPPYQAGMSEQEDVVWFSRLLDECYFRMPAMRQDLTKLNVNVQKKGESGQNLAVIYSDVLRQQAQAMRKGVLHGADEYSEKAYAMRTAKTDDARVNAWNAFDAVCRHGVGLSSTDYGLPYTLDKEGAALYKKLYDELYDKYTATDRTPEDNFNIASKACEILFEEEQQDEQQDGEGDGDGSSDGEGDQAGEGSGGEGEEEGSDDEQGEGESKQAQWGRTELDVDTHKIGTDNTFQPEPTYKTITPLETIVRVPKGVAEPSRRSQVERVLTFKLSHQVRNLLKVMAQARWSGGYKRGKLNKRAIASVTTGNERVFRQKEQREVLDTAVMLLVDSSGSMSGSKYTKAVAATVALSEVLTQTHIPHAVHGFTTTGRDNLMYDHVSFGKWPSKEDVLTSMCARDVGLAGNADAEALLYSADVLARQKQKRKVMIVLSDGQPADGDDPDTFLKRVAADLDASRGIELYAIGIQDRSVSRYYKNYRIINDASQLEKELLSLLKESILN